MAARLTPAERLLRSVSETAFADQVLDLARLLGWRSLHIRPARTKHGWVTPVAGDGRGFPDLLLVRPRDRRLVFAELKREVGGELSLEQAGWMAAWTEIIRWQRFATDDEGIDAVRIDGPYLWRPRDLTDPVADSVIGRCLR